MDLAHPNQAGHGDLHREGREGASFAASGGSETVHLLAGVHRLSGVRCGLPCPGSARPVVGCATPTGRRLLAAAIAILLLGAIGIVKLTRHRATDVDPGTYAALIPGGLPGIAPAMIAGITRALAGGMPGCLPRARRGTGPGEGPQLASLQRVMSPSVTHFCGRVLTVEVLTPAKAFAAASLLRWK